jgi:hypothetical protein
VRSGLILEQIIQNVDFCLDGGVYEYYHQGWVAGKQGLPALLVKNEAFFAKLKKAEES